MFKLSQDAERAGLLAGIDEVIHLTTEGRVVFTVIVDQGKATVRGGAAAGVVATLTVPWTGQLTANLATILADGKLAPDEIFNISYVLFIPCLRRIHQMFYFMEPGDKASFQVDNFMQFRLSNPQGFTYHGTKVDVAATVLNVDGFFVYLEGLVGDPDVRYEVSLADALKLYRMLVYDAERARGSMWDLRKLGKSTQDILQRSITYQRQWH